MKRATSKSSSDFFDKGSKDSLGFHPNCRSPADVLFFPQCGSGAGVPSREIRCSFDSSAKRKCMENMHTRKKKNLTTTSGVLSVPTISPSEYGLQSPFFPSSTSPDIVSSRYHGLGSVMHPALGKFNEIQTHPPGAGYPSHSDGLELVIQRQPAKHHRARYHKEGSRGCIKDTTGKSCPAIQLKGLDYFGPRGPRITSSVLQVYIGTETGGAYPHPLYRIHHVHSKTLLPCREMRVDKNTPLLQIDIPLENDGFVSLNFLGILKLRNMDLEAAVDPLKAPKKREPFVRLVFNSLTTVQNLDGSTRTITLQVSSTPICCRAPVGTPEIFRMSHGKWPACGGTEVILLGRKFVRSESQLFVQEVDETDEEQILWQQEVAISQGNFSSVHLVASMVPYRNPKITMPVQVQLVIRQKGSTSEPFRFEYIPTVPPRISQPLRHLILPQPLQSSRSPRLQHTQPSSRSSFGSKTERTRDSVLRFGPAHLSRSPFSSCLLSGDGFSNAASAPSLQSALGPLDARQYQSLAATNLGEGHLSKVRQSSEYISSAEGSTWSAEAFWADPNKDLIASRMDPQWEEMLKRLVKRIME